MGDGVACSRPREHVSSSTFFSDPHAHEDESMAPGVAAIGDFAPLPAGGIFR
jgi:hypothetical protein